MTAISGPRALTRTTPLERMLLRAASALDHFVAVSYERRARESYRDAMAAQADYAVMRSRAEAAGAIGLLPR